MSTPQHPARGSRSEAQAGADRARRRERGRRGRRRTGAVLTLAGVLLAALLVAVIETSTAAGGHAAQGRRTSGSTGRSDPSAGGGSRSAATSGGARNPHGSPAGTAAPHGSDARARGRRHHHHRRRHHHRRSPGSLPQTSAVPSSHTLAFRREMSSLWRAIVTDSPRLARRAFFPEGAYLQLKEIGDPAADFQDRLLRDYALDIGAAHRLLGRGARKAVLVGVRVPAGYAHWVPPGVCYNSIGYYETPNSRLLYREHGRLHSFGIASMISWRGVWYVVHLGAILRTGEEGIVESPAEGPGISEPSSTC